MAKYRKRAVEVDAILWTGQNVHEVLEFLGPAPGKDEHVFDIGKGTVIIRSIDVAGDWRAERDQYILKVNGRFKVMAKEVFELIYESVPIEAT